MVRKHGLTIDSLEAAEIVLADGRTLRTSAKEHPDLFWAIRGGGGNFGVVTSFDFRAHPVQSILGGMTIYPVTELESVLAGWPTICIVRQRNSIPPLLSFLDLGPRLWSLPAMAETMKL